MGGFAPVLSGCEPSFEVTTLNSPVLLCGGIFARCAFSFWRAAVFRHAGATMLVTRLFSQRSFVP